MAWGFLWPVTPGLFIFFALSASLGPMEPILKTSRLVSAHFVHCLCLSTVPRLIVVRWGGLPTAVGTLSACSNSDDGSTAGPCSGKTMRAIQLSVGEINYRHFFDTFQTILWCNICWAATQVQKISSDQTLHVFYWPVGEKMTECWVAKTKEKREQDLYCSPWTHLSKQSNKKELVCL